MSRAHRLTLLMAVFTAGCQRPSLPAELSAADVAAIRATSERWMAAAREGRWEDAAATYTADAVLWFPNSAFEGRGAILKYFQAQQPMTNMTLHIDEIRGRGDLAFVSGLSMITPPGGAPFVAGKYLDIRLRQADGSWLFYRDMVSPVPRP